MCLLQNKFYIFLYREPFEWLASFFHFLLCNEYYCSIIMIEMIMHCQNTVEMCYVWGFLDPWFLYFEIHFMSPYALSKVSGLFFIHKMITLIIIIIIIISSSNNKAKKARTYANFQYFMWLFHIMWFGIFVGNTRVKCQIVAQAHQFKFVVETGVETIIVIVLSLFYLLS